MRRWLLLVLTAIVCAALVTDWARVPTEPVHEGDVAERTVKAPFRFVYNDLDGFAAARARARADAPPVYVYDDGSVADLTARLRAAFRDARSVLTPASAAADGSTEGVAGDVPAGAAATPVEPTAEQRRAATRTFLGDLGIDVAERQVRPLADAGFPVEAENAVVGWVEVALSDRFVLADRQELPDDGRDLWIQPRASDREAFRLTELDRVVEPDDIERRITLAAVEDGDDAWADAAASVARPLVRPNLAYDAERTTKAADAAEGAVRMETIGVQRGETLFREGDKITSTQARMYEALQSSRSDKGALLSLVTSAAFLLLLLGSLYLAARHRFDRETGTRDLAAISGVIGMMALLGRIVVSSSPGIADLIGNNATAESVWFLVPVAGAAMLTRILLGSRRAAFVAVAVAAVCGLLMRLDALYVVYFLLTSLVAATSVEHLRERIEVLRAGVWTGAFGALAALLLHFLELYGGSGELSLSTTVRPLWSMGFAFAGGVLSGFFVLAVIPIFESVGFVTDHRMLELASLNHPLLRKLMLRAPGTYHHSVVVGTLAEAACDAIGANSLQAKISAYFHDIGKTIKPRFFVENQRGGANPHGGLDPAASAEIIIGHVVDGARMAREHNLPKPILDNILMHHGTGLLQYFFAKAQMEADDPASVDEATFRYPGPRPNTREAGVVMLADKVEAATRTIKHPTEENIRAMINRIINSVIADHQFAECPLTFQEIHVIADAFVYVLLGIYHQRIEYPDTAGISQAGAPGLPAPAQPAAASRVGTITLELETRAVASGGSGLWNEDDGELTDETTDYESVRNLPQGDL
ncbi:MAG: HDIG domain-containing protein [Alphaproteobacteria bacterium]|nr:HDIG domain-containing protein [Alphaproteobacteria bacterium]